jgi:hypothetical protein
VPTLILRPVATVWTRLLSFVLSLTVLLLAVAPVLATSISTDLWVYQQGDTVNVSGDGFGASENVEIVTTDPYAVEVDRGIVTSDEFGNIAYSFVLTSDVPGIYDVVATGLTSGLTASTQFDPWNLNSVGDLTTVEGNLASHVINFPVDLTGSGSAITLYWRTQDGTATGGAACGGSVDFISVSQTTGQSKSADFSVPVTICEDTTSEVNELFTLQVSTSSTFPSSGSGTKTGTATITNDDNSLSINDVSVLEGISSTSNAVFTVSLDQASPGTIKLDYATADVTAQSGTCPSGKDYNSTTGTLTFAPGVTTQPINVPICGDTTIEPDETFVVNLTANATSTTSYLIGDSRGQGTITNDDPVNDAPTCTDPQSGSTDEDVNLLDSVVCSDVDGDSLTYSLVTDASNGSVTLAADGSFTYDPDLNFNGSDSFTFKASDGLLDSNIATYNITVDPVNDAPVIQTIGAVPSSINENQSTTVTVTFTDVEAGDAHTCKFTWGDGGISWVNVGAGVTICSGTHTYLDDNPTATPSDNYTVSVEVKDSGSPPQSDTEITTVTVGNVRPVITTTSGPVAPAAKNTSLNFSASFTDVGTLDTHTCTFSWDDGTNTTVNAPGTGNGSCSASHTYASAGVYTVMVTVTDDDTGSDTRTLEFLVVVYDPSAGFVTGGGWIMTYPGSYPADPTLSGRANFGFVAKYKAKSTTPVLEGDTEFQFQVAGLNFHSDAYSSLVVSNFRAQYRGTGTVNGVSGYDFVVTGYDGNISGGGGYDKFRIKISKNGVVVYDNRMGVSDDIDYADPQIISGGSIVIHK